MQISLDFYRILGVSHRATIKQLQQAFDDRLQQLPRQEYSSVAIAGRKQLLEEAFVTLGDAQKRQDYDQKLKAQEELAENDSRGIAVDTPDKNLAGTLLVLQEMGAYAQIVEIGNAYFQCPVDLSKLPIASGAPESDIVLAMALAHLELGREQWQQSQFELAGESLQVGLDLLKREQQFPSVQAEIQGDLFKLRPYRILEALDDEQPEQRQKGLVLLQSMLDDRDGIDGNQDDQSGLSVNDFLRFVQQLREYLTVEEQQTLFEREAARPSAVASYLAVYALIARGVSEGTPSLIERAKTLLTHLGDRQDVAIEVGMCWLLLGQPSAAHQSVQLSQDQESIAFMRQYSGGALDLIPGLYLYTENWLQQEVYPYFRDLLDRKVSLQSYFNDPAIQRELSAIEPGPLGVKVPSQLRKDRERAESSATSSVSPPSAIDLGSAQELSVSLAQGADLKTAESWSTLWDTDSTDPFADTVSAASPSQNGPASTPVSARQRPSTSPDGSKLGQTQELRRKVRQGKSKAAANRPKKRLRRWVPWAAAFLLGTVVVAGALGIGRLIKPKQAVVENSEDSTSPTADVTSDAPSTSVSGVVTPSPAQSAAVLPSPASSGAASVPGSAAASASPSASPNSSKAASVTPSGASAQKTSGPLSQSDAKQLVQSWQSAKAEAMGESHNAAGLKQILDEPALRQWQYSIDQVQQNKGYWKYTLDQLDVLSVTPSGANQALIKAQVKETAQYFERDKLVADKSYTDNYQVQYSAVRKDSQWLLNDMKVL